jgi:hypothetical protein
MNPEELERRVREMVKADTREWPTAGATAAWRDVLLPHLARKQLLAAEAKADTEPAQSR